MPFITVCEIHIVNKETLHFSFKAIENYLCKYIMKSTVNGHSQCRLYVTN